MSPSLCDLRKFGDVEVILACSIFFQLGNCVLLTPETGVSYSVHQVQ